MAAALVVLTALSLGGAALAGPGKGGGKGTAWYRVTLFGPALGGIVIGEDGEPGPLPEPVGGMYTDAGCNAEAFLYAQEANGYLKAVGAGPEGAAAPPLLMRIAAPSYWVRSHDAGKGTTGYWNDGCYGATAYAPGALYIYRAGDLAGQGTVRFDWEFDIYAAGRGRNSHRESFRITSDAIPVTWAVDGNVAQATVAGQFTFRYSHPDAGIESMDLMVQDFAFLLIVERL